MRGWVYVIANPAMYGLVKIGFSTKDPMMRAKELGGTGVPHPHVVMYEALIHDAWNVEQTAHKLLDDRREGKEWFRCSVNSAIDAIRKAIGTGVIHLEKRYDSVEARKPNPEEIFSGQVAMDIADGLFTDASVLVELCKEFPRNDVTRSRGEPDESYIAYLQRASELSVIEATELLHEYAQTGFGECFPSDEIEGSRLASVSMAHYLALAKTGDGHANNRLGQCYHHGEYVPEDCAKALSFYMAAWEVDYAPVCLSLYLFFRDQPGKLETSFEWLHRSVMLVPDWANTYKLARCYANGIGVAQDFVAAAKWEQTSKDLSPPGILELRKHQTLVFDQNKPRWW